MLIDGKNYGSGVKLVSIRAILQLSTITLVKTKSTNLAFLSMLFNLTELREKLYELRSMENKGRKPNRREEQREKMSSNPHN